jgi:phosphoenolpyruvate-protein phosphotransferase (PTS system enzyme I)
MLVLAERRDDGVAVARIRDSSSDRFSRGDGTTDRHNRDLRRSRKLIYKGVTVVPGIAMGTVRLKFRQTQVLSDQTITYKDVEREYERLNEAVRLSKEQLLETRGRVQRDIGEIEAMIFDAHLAILEDQGFLKKIRAQVQSMLKPVEVVVSEIVEGYYRLLSMKEAEELRERAADIRDIGRRMLDNLAKLKNPGEEYPDGEEAIIGDSEIIFAREILPSDLVTIEHRHCKGVISETGSGRGHAGVMLRAMNVPTVMGLDGLAENLLDGDYVIVDGTNGMVYVNPKKDVVDSFTKTLQEFDNYKSVLRSEVDLPAITTDGFPISLLANVSKQSDIDLAKLYNVDGIGLFRSEFHLMVGSSFPDEEEQYQLYRNAIEKMDGKPVTIRTMDLGSDKKLPYVKFADAETHALGRRSIRLVPELEEFQLIQLRAILRASAHGNARLMWPFITSLEDIRLAKRLVRIAKKDLDTAKKKYDANIPIGMMVEVPAAALSLDKYVRDVQFFSVGTNDLTQYVCAADRNQADVAPWYKSHNPGMLALMRIIVESAKANDADLTICGEMAGDPFYTMFLLGLGVTKLSMSAPQVPLVKKIIRSVNISGATNLANRALQTTSTSQIRELFATTVQQILGRDLGGWTRTTGE